MSNWTASPTDKSTATLDDTKFVYQEAEKHLKEIVESNDILVNRSATVLLLTAGLLIGLIGYAFDRFIANMYGFDPILVAIICAILYLGSIVVYLKKNFEGQSSRSVGAAPQTLLTGNFFSTRNEDHRQKQLIWAQIENYQDSIVAGRQLNEKLAKRFRYSINSILLLPLLMALGFIFQTYLYQA